MLEAAIFVAMAEDDEAKAHQLINMLEQLDPKGGAFRELLTVANMHTMSAEKLRTVAASLPVTTSVPV